MGKDHKGNCFLAALSFGFMKIDPTNGKKELNKVMHEEKCPNCRRTTLKATVKSLLNQPDCGGMYYAYAGEGGAAYCSSCQCRYYLTNACEQDPAFEPSGGKFHNHCTSCPGLGQCIGDYRETHCDACGGHYHRNPQGCYNPNCDVGKLYDPNIF